MSHEPSSRFGGSFLSAVAVFTLLSVLTAPLDVLAADHQYGNNNNDSHGHHHQPRRYVNPDDPASSSEVFGSITVCKIVTNTDGEITEGGEQPGTTFTIPAVSPGLDEVGIFGDDAVFTTPLDFTDNFIGINDNEDQSDDTQCIKYNELPLGSYYYGQEVISPSTGWAVSLYNDQFDQPVLSLSDFFPWHDNINSDGNVVLTEEIPDRTIIVYNRLLKQEQPTTARITVVKETVGGDGSFDFNGLDDGFTLTTSHASASESFDVDADNTASGSSYTITEEPQSNWVLTSASCEYDNEESGISVTYGKTVTVHPGDEVICTFVNTNVQPTPTPGPTARITVVKEIEDGPDGTFHFSGLGGEGFNLTTSNASASESFDVFADDESGTYYTISENPQEDWSLEDSICEYDGQEEGAPVENGETVRVHPGDEVTCTFTNLFTGKTSPSPTPPPNHHGGGGSLNGTLNVEKVLWHGELASVSFSDFSFIIEGTAHQFEADGANSLSLGQGTYSVAEIPVEGFTTTYSGDCNPNGQVTVTSGQTSTCVIQNTYSVGGFNPEPTPTPSPTPTLTPLATPVPNEEGTTGNTLGSPGGESPSPSASPSLGQTSADTMGVAAIGSMADWPICVPGNIGWILLSLVLNLLAVLWLQRGVFKWKKSALSLGVLAVILVWLMRTCGNNLAWLPVLLAILGYIWLSVRGRSDR